MSYEDLYEDFFFMVFNKAKLDSKTFTKTSQARYLSEIILKSEYVSTKTLVRLYNKYITKFNIEAPTPRAELLDKLATYIGYKSFLDFTEGGSRNKANSNIENITKPQLESILYETSSTVEKMRTGLEAGSVKLTTHLNRSLDLYFDLDEFSNKDIAEVIAILSDVYESVSEDELEIVGSEMLELCRITQLA